MNNKVKEILEQKKFEKECIEYNICFVCGHDLKCRDLGPDGHILECPNSSEHYCKHYSNCTY